LVTRLQPARAAIKTLVATEEVAAVLQVVRYLDDAEGEPEDLTPSAEGLEKLPGQHQLLGWHLDQRAMEFFG
jgi:hypothetical protein